jgi:exosome complex RNA-binding protein Csl4
VRHDGNDQGKAPRPSGSDEGDDDEDDEDEDDTLRRRTTSTRPLLAVRSARALSLQPQEPDLAQPSTSAVVVPRPGDVVTGRVTRVGPATAQVALLCAGAEGRALPTFPGAAPFPGSGPTAGAFRGVIRKQDVRRTDVDGVVMGDCFRPGDVVRCAVLSLGDSRAYFLSTAANELGVVAARSASSGQGMVAVSWQEMACPLTGCVERRKVARVVAPAAKTS